MSSVEDLAATVARADGSRAPSESVTPASAGAHPATFHPSARLWMYLALVALMYASALVYASYHGLSITSLYFYGLLQPPGLTGEDTRLMEIETPLSWNVPRVLWYVYIKGAAVLVELFQYWLIGMLIAGALIVFVSWEKLRARMGHGGVRANSLAAAAGAVIPICSCGIVPVLAGMVEAGIPLGPTMAFLVAAPMLNVPTVFMTAGVLGWPMAIARVIATFAIALVVGHVLSMWQRKHRSPRYFLKIHVPPRLSPDLQEFAFRFGMLATNEPDGVRAEQLGARAETKLALLEEAGVAERDRNGLWKLVDATSSQIKSVGACAVLPTGAALSMTLGQKLAEALRVGLRLFIQLNGYLLLAVLIAGAIKVLFPTILITQWVGGTTLNSVLVASAVAVFAYVCTYVEVPTALALMAKGMGPGSTLAYLLGGPGLSLPSIAMLSGVFKTNVLVLYVGVSFLGCVIAGYVFNLVM